MMDQPDSNGANEGIEAEPQVAASQCSTMVADAVVGPDESIDDSGSRTPADEKDVEKGGQDAAKVSDELQDQSNFLPRRQVITVFLCVSAGIFLSVLDQTLVATALPSITKDFNSGSTSTWVATAYLLTGCAVQPIYGRLSDILGRKVMLLTAMGIFVVFSLGCALAQSITQLIVFRALAGVGGGPIVSLSMIIISDVVSLKQRGKYQGIIGAVIALGNGVGPLVGAVFSERASWRWCFWINLPIAITAMVICTFVLPLKRVRGDLWTKFRRIDFLGSFLVLGSIVPVLLGLNWGGQTYSWTTAHVLVPLIVGVAAFAVFMLWEAFGATLPIIPFRIFKQRTIVGIYITTLALGLCFFIPLFYIPQFFQTVRGFSAISAGLMLLPLLIVQVAVSALCGWFVSKTGYYRPPVIIGYMIWAVGNGLISTFDASVPVGKAIGFLIIQGVGAGMTFQTSLVGALAAAKKSDMAVVTATRNFIRMLSGTLAVAISSSVISNELGNAVSRQSLPPAIASRILADPTLLSNAADPLSLTATQTVALKQGYVQGFRDSFYIAAGFCVVAFLSAVFIAQDQNLVRQGEAEAKEEAKRWFRERKERRRARGGLFGHGERGSSSQGVGAGVQGAEGTSSVDTHA